MSTNPTKQVKSSVVSALGPVPAGGERYADTVFSAIQAEVDRAVRSLRSTAQAEGLPSATVERALLTAGLTTPAPVVRATPPRSFASSPAGQTTTGKQGAVDKIVEGLRDLLGGR